MKQTVFVDTSAWLALINEADTDHIKAKRTLEGFLSMRLRDQGSGLRAKHGKRLCPECKGIIKPGRTEMVFEVKDLKVTSKMSQQPFAVNAGAPLFPAELQKKLTDRK